MSTENPTWQSALKNSITDLKALCAELNLDPNRFPHNNDDLRGFPLRVPRGFVSRMEKGNPNDPLLLQVLPQMEELKTFPGYSHDPLTERAFNPTPGLLHKYRSRVLLTLTGGCAIHCRYCFRRHFPYESNMPDKTEWSNILTYLANDNRINEVILSGGDPLIVTDAVLMERIFSLEPIPHIKRLRIHTRLPVVIPERITDQLILGLKKSRFQKILVLHSNHANEISEDVVRALKKLHDISVTLLNQTVLLKGVNDNEKALLQLSEQLFTAGLIPYYLHLLDRVSGAAHFDISEVRAQELMSYLMKNLPGYLVPKLVREIPGALAKTPVFVSL